VACLDEIRTKLTLQKGKSVKLDLARDLSFVFHLLNSEWEQRRFDVVLRG